MVMKLSKVAVVTGLLAAPLWVEAGPTLTLTADGAPVVSCADGAACDQNALAGVVTFIGTVGAFTVNVTTGESKPLLGNNPIFDLNSVDTQTGGGNHSLRIQFSDTGFTTPGQIS